MSQRQALEALLDEVDAAGLGVSWTAVDDGRSACMLVGAHQRIGAGYETPFKLGVGPTPLAALTMAVHAFRDAGVLR